MTLSRFAGALLAVIGGVFFSCDAPPPPPNATVYKDWKIAGNGHWIHLPGARDADGTGYLSSFQGVQAIDEHTGYVKWTSPTVPKEEWETVARAAELVLAYPRALKSDSVPHYLRALDAKTGNPKWQYENFLATSAPIAVAERALWIVNRAGDLVSLDLATGKPGFTASLKQGSLAGDDMGLAIAKAGQTLLVARGRDGVVEGRDLTTGALRWTYTLDGPLRMISLLAQAEAAWIGVNDSRAVVSTESGIFAFDAGSGKPVWNHPLTLKNYYRTHFQVNGDSLFWADYEADRTATLHCVDAATGRERWTAGGFQYLEDKDFVRKVGDLWVVPTASAVTVLSAEGKKLSTVDAFVANTAGGQSFASSGEFGYTLEAAPPPKKTWEPVQRSNRETSSLITFWLRTGEVVGKKSGGGIYELAVVHGRLLMVNNDGLQSIAVAP